MGRPVTQLLFNRVNLWLNAPHEIEDASIRHKGEFIAGDLADKTLAKFDREGHPFFVPKRRERACEEHGDRFHAALGLDGVLFPVPQKKQLVNGESMG